jgi:hypothetical protein
MDHLLNAIVGQLHMQINNLDLFTSIQFIILVLEPKKALLKRKHDTFKYHKAMININKATLIMKDDFWFAILMKIKE